MSGSGPRGARAGISAREALRKRLPLAACALCAAVAAMGGCSSGAQRADDAQSGSQPTEAVSAITAEQARELMISDQDVVLDVRTQEEFDASHIVNARLLPVDEITAETAAQVAPDKDRAVFVYCRTGIRSAEAAEKLADLGYAEIYDFGGILSWPYDTVDADADADEGAKVYESDQLPVGVKVVCGKTRALPEEGE